MSKYSVLVVDDQNHWLEMAIEHLKGDFQVDTASNYDEAITKIEKKKPPYNVLISDIRLNEGDPRNTQGLEIAEYLNDQGLGDLTKVIFWTAYESHETAIRATKLNAIDYFPKSKQGSDGRRIHFDAIREEFIEKVKLAAELSLQKRWDKSILIIDENSEWVSNLSIILNNYGYETEILSDLKSTVSYVKLRQFKTIITELPTQSNYFEYINRINTNNTDTKIIVISDQGDKNTIRDLFVKYSVVDYFTKHEADGFREEDFIKCIEKIYRPENELYIVANIEKKQSNTFVYSLKTKKHVLRSENAITIWFPPYKKELEIDVFLYTENIENETEDINIKPSDTQRWIVSKDTYTQPVQFTISADCQFIIFAELFESEQGWWKRIKTIPSIKDGKNK